MAERALAGAERGKAVVVPGVFNRCLRGLGTLCPRDAAAKLILRRWERSLGKMESAEDTAWYTRGGDAA